LQILILVKVVSNEPNLYFLVDRFVPEVDGLGVTRMLRGALTPSASFRVKDAPIPDYIHWTTDEVGIVSRLNLILMP
jgi:hypothetical protein